MHRPGGVDPLVTDDRLGPPKEHRVVENQQLRVEERRQLVAGPVREPVADLLQLRVGAFARAVEGLEFVVDAVWSNRETHHVGMAGEHHGAAHDHAG